MAKRITFYRQDDTSEQLLSWFPSMKGMTWARTLRGKFELGRMKKMN